MTDPLALWTMQNPEPEREYSRRTNWFFARDKFHIAHPADQIAVLEAWLFDRHWHTTLAMQDRHSGSWFWEYHCAGRKASAREPTEHTARLAAIAAESFDWSLILAAVSSKIAAAIRARSA